MIRVQVQMDNLDLKTCDLGDWVYSLHSNLSYDHRLYFDLTEPHFLIPIGFLVHARIRKTGCENASKLMKLASIGEHARRRPITVSRITDNKFLIVDGNSTALVAKLNSWRDIPANYR